MENPDPLLSFLTVIGLVIGCDSDDGPKVTAPTPTPTRDTTAEQQGRDGLEVTENGTMIRNKGEVALNVRFNYDDPRHYRLNADTAMPSDPANAGSAPARVACGVPATGRANGQCFNNDGVPTPEPYSSGGPTRNVESERDGLRCREATNSEIRNVCNDITINQRFFCNVAGGHMPRIFSIGPGERMTNRPDIGCMPGILAISDYQACAAPGVPQPTAEGPLGCFINTGITPVRYTGTPQPLYGSIAFGHTSSNYAWTIRFGSTRSEAQSQSLAFCRSEGGTNCESLEFTRGQCAALAVGTGQRPAWGMASERIEGQDSGRAKLEAQNRAIATCRSHGGTNCRIDTGDEGSVSSMCLTSS